LLSTIRAFGRRWLRRRRVRDMGHRSLSRYGLPTRPSQHVWPGCFKGRRAHHWRWCQSILPQGPVRYRRGTLLEGQAEYVGSPYIRPVPRLLCLSPIIMSRRSYLQLRTGQCSRPEGTFTLLLVRTFRRTYPGTSCQATIGPSLRDLSPSGAVRRCWIDSSPC
jgi:hypothetical protein